eukprot:CAMPEP_0177733468 /NCGR_PEP_ID=MMETSP0484_2-20121128/23696_1 /TAXON_ID=354590 /ORGANISM="Rhodomonas lens, Strain RHODO" /LENGTH=45 /DNA_ID= /DNA_START= /DNA_END= /DNA_ORIENTATION=
MILGRHSALIASAAAPFVSPEANACTSLDPSSMPPAKSSEDIQVA